MAENSVDSVVTDPPYGWRFMGKAWDGADIVEKAKRAPTTAQQAGEFQGPNRGYANTSSSAGEYDLSLTGNQAFQHFTEEWAREAFRVLKPGGHMLVFCGPRTYHRMASGVEDAGFEIRDMLSWIFATGFPKSLNCRKAAIKAGIGCGCETLPEHDVRSLQETDLSAPVDDAVEREEALQQSVSEQSLPEHRPQGRANVGPGESVLAGRELHRTGEGLSDDTPAIPSQGESERVCAGAHSGSGENTGAAAESGRGGAPHQSRSSGQSARESESVRGSQSALDGAPFPRCTRCARPIFPEGLGTARKPAHEGIVLARKPLSEKTVAANVLKHGTGGINVDGCRITVDRANEREYDKESQSGITGDKGSSFGSAHARNDSWLSQGRFPANLLLDETAAEMLDAQTQHVLPPWGGNSKKHAVDTDGSIYGKGIGNDSENERFKDGVGASRFFYVAKASKRERNEGCEELGAKEKQGARPNSADATGKFPDHDHRQSGGNNHPTVKPIQLMRYLCRLITPPGGTVLDPFAGSGSTGVAALREGFSFIGIEREAEYVEIARRRLQYTEGVI